MAINIWSDTRKKWGGLEFLQKWKSKVSGEVTEFTLTERKRAHALGNSHRVDFAFPLSCFCYHLDLTGLMPIGFFSVNLCIHSFCLACAHKKVYFSLQIVHVRQTNPSVAGTGEKSPTAKGISAWICLGFFVGKIF